MRKFTRQSVSRHWTSFLLVFTCFMFSATSVFSQVELPSGIGMATDTTAAYNGNGWNISNAKLDNLDAGDWFEYDVTSAGGDFNFTILCATNRGNSSLRVDYYKTGTEAYPLNDSTIALPKTGWNLGDANEYNFPISLEAGVTYTVRMTLVGNGTNIYGIGVYQDGSTDATLDSLTVGGITPSAFTSGEFDISDLYNVILPVGTTTATVAAKTKDAAATITSGLGDITLVNGQGSAMVNIKAESGHIQDYVVTAFTPKDLGDDAHILNIASNATSIVKKDMSGNSDDAIQNTNGGDYFEYQVYATSAGMYSATLNFSTQRDGSAASIDYYKVSDSIMVIGDTVAIANDGWSNYSPYLFFMELEANEEYIMRLNVINAGWNMKPISSFQSVDSVQTDKIRLVPTVEGDSATMFSIMDHNTGVDGTITVKAENNSFDAIKNGATAKFQIKPTKTGIFDVVLNLGSNQAPAKVSMSLYNTLTGEWIADSDTISPNTGNFNTKEDRSFRFALDSGMLYTTQINFISDGGWVCNVYGVSVVEYLTTNDASLSNLMVDGVSVDGFNSATMEYSITLPKGSTDVPATTVETGSEGATVVITDAPTLSDTTKVVVTSEDSTVVNTYAIVFEVVGPYMGVAASIPGVVEYEHWDVGGEGLGYHDNDAGGPRTELNGTRTNVAYTGAGEWLTYTVDVTADAEYQVRARVASQGVLGYFTLSIDGDSITTIIPVNTGAWQTYATNIVDTVTLAAGLHDIKWEMSGDVAMNLDYFQLLDLAAISTDATLASISLNDSVDLDSFDAATMKYTVMVDSVQEIETMISALATDAAASVAITQATMVDSSTAVITVTAEDLTTVLTYEVMFVVNSASSLNEIRQVSNINLYPNPVQDVLNITAENDILSVKLYSISGALVNEFAGFGSKEVSLSLNVDRGMYIVSVSTSEGTLTKQLIKQ